jgi:hypothetical protein
MPNSWTRLIATGLLLSSVALACARRQPSVSRVDAVIAEMRGQIAELQGGLSSAEDAASPTWTVAKLANMVEVDQYIRTTSPPEDLTPEQLEAWQREFVALSLEIERQHIRVLRRLLEQHGWFVISRFGKQADLHAWLLTQHADSDVAFQKHVLTMLEPLVDQGETDPQNYAYLYDRIAMNEGRPQRFGTQGDCVGPRWQPLPLDDEGRVDEFRARVGLPPIAEYEALFEGQCP